MDEDGDGVCADEDVDDTNPNCGVEDIDGDGDGYCADHDCDDTSANCTSDCSDSDGNGTPDCRESCGAEPVPELITTIPISDSQSEPVRGLFVYNGYIYAIEYSTQGLFVIDISDPNNPVIVNNVSVVYPAAIYIDNNRAYVVTSIDDLIILDLTDPQQPSIISEFQFASPEFPVGIDIVVSGNYAYAADEESGLYKIDISDPTNPRVVGSATDYEDIPYTINNIAQNSTHIFMGVDGIAVVDKDSMDSFLALNSLGMRLTSTRIVFAKDNYVYGLEYNELDIVEVIDPADPYGLVLRGVLDGIDGDSLYVSGNYAYVAGENGLYIVDVSDIRNPALVTLFDLPARGVDIQVMGDYAYVADESGIEIIRLNCL